MSTSIAARLNRLPPTRTHRHATIIAGIGTFFDLFDIFLAGVLGAVLTQQFALDRLSLPAALSSAFVGMFIGATLLGRFADRFGRRTAFLLNLSIYSAFTLAGGFSTNATMLIATRFLAGIGIGAELPLVDAYLGELAVPMKSIGPARTVAFHRPISTYVNGLASVGFAVDAMVEVPDLTDERRPQGRRPADRADAEIPLFLGLIVTLPVLGHATWHLYRATVVAAPVQESSAGEPSAATTDAGSATSRVQP